ncbi:hypothetical protein ACJX0J_026557 [Zea mays]
MEKTCAGRECNYFIFLFEVHHVAALCLDMFFLKELDGTQHSPGSTFTNHFISGIKPCGEDFTLRLGIIDQHVLSEIIKEQNSIYLVSFIYSIWTLTIGRKCDQWYFIEIIKTTEKKFTTNAVPVAKEKKC